MKINKHIKLTEGALATFEAPTATNKRRFEMEAYTGAPVNGGLMGAVIVDLKGMNSNGQSRPIFRQHDHNRIAGYSDSIAKDNSLRIGGTISAKTEAGREVSELADEGFPWQCSIGFDIQKIEQLKAGDSAEVNGRTFEGPGVVVRQSLLKECSFVPLGADGATSALIFAEREDGEIDLTPIKETQMELTIESLKADHPAVYQAAFEAGQAQGKLDAAEKPAKAGELKAAFASDPGFAIDCLGEDLSLNQAKAKFADILAPKLEAANAKIVELEAKLAEATTGQGAVGFVAPAPATPAMPADLSPKAQAEWEWDNQPEAKTQASCKDNYVFARAAELDGSHRTFTRKAD